MRQIIRFTVTKCIFPGGGSKNDTIKMTTLTFKNNYIHIASMLRIIIRMDRFKERWRRKKGTSVPLWESVPKRVIIARFEAAFRGWFAGDRARFPRLHAEFRRWRRLISFSFAGGRGGMKIESEVCRNAWNSDRSPLPSWMGRMSGCTRAQLGPRIKNSHTANTEERSIKRHSTAIIK